MSTSTNATETFTRSRVPMLPPATPRNTLPKPFFSTPSNNKASASFASSQGASTTGLRLQDVAPGIERDLEKHQQCTLKSMQTFLLKSILPGEQDLDGKLARCMEEAKEICTSPEMLERLEDLKNKLSFGDCESAMYIPYIALTNEILAQCRTGLRELGQPSDLDIICLCNDPNVIIGNHDEQNTYRKPDLVYINWRGILRHGNRASSWEAARQWVEASFSDSTNRVSLQLDWSQVLMMDELKKTSFDEKQMKDIRLYSPSEGKVVPYANPAKFVAGMMLEVPALVSLHTVSSAHDAKVSTGSKRKQTSQTASASSSKRRKTSATDNRGGGLTEVDNAGKKKAKAKGKGKAKTKPTAKDPNRPPPMVQMAIYASEMLSVEGLIRDHGLGMLTQDGWTWLWYFDSAGAIQAQGFNILAHTADFVFILMLLQRFNLPQWGFPQGTNSEAKLDVVRGLPESRDETPGPAGHTRLMPAAPGAKTFEVVGTDRKGVPKTMVVNPTRVLYKPSPVLKGRRTMVLEAQDPDMPTTSYVAKWSYPQTTRHNEAETIWIAREIVEEVDKSALGAMTDVIAFKDFSHLSTNTIRGHLRLVSDPTQSLIDAEHYGERILRCIFEVEFKPLTYLSDLEFVRGIINCIHCHMILWIGNGKYRVEHTDVSFWNLGVCPFSLCIRLRDFDLARVVVAGQPSKPQGSERTGTVPFMALDLLTEAYWNGQRERLYRHDLEAFVWVAMYFAWAFDDEGLEDLTSPVQVWLTGDYDQCRLAKGDFLRTRAGELPDWMTSEDTPLGYALSFARMISQWLVGEEAQRRKAANPKVDVLDRFAKKNHLSRSRGDELEEAKHDFELFWAEIEAIHSAVKDVEPTPERVNYYMEREKKITAMNTQREAEEAKLDREANAEERERKKAKREAEQEARKERDRNMQLRRKVISAL